MSRLAGKGDTVFWVEQGTSPRDQTTGWRHWSEYSDRTEARREAKRIGIGRVLEVRLDRVYGVEPEQPAQKLTDVSLDKWRDGVKFLMGLGVNPTLTSADQKMLSECHRGPFVKGVPEHLAAGLLETHARWRRPSARAVVQPFKDAGDMV